MSEFVCPHGSPPRAGIQHRRLIKGFRQKVRVTTGPCKRDAEIRLAGVCARFPPCLATLDGERIPYPAPVLPNPGGTGFDPDTPPGGAPIALRLAA